MVSNDNESIFYKSPIKKLPQILALSYKSHLFFTSNESKNKARIVFIDNATRVRNGGFGVFNRYRNSFDFFFDCYNEETVFRRGVYFDAKVNPAQHFKAHMGLEKYCELISPTGFASFQCSPLRSKGYPMYTTIDTRISVTEILCIGMRQSRLFTSNLERKTMLWKKVFNFNKKPFKRQGANKEIQFRGTISTDGVGVSILKSNAETRAGGRRIQAIAAQENEFQYITEVNPFEFQQHLTSNCIVVDPNRRDIMYCMHESSAIEDPLVMRFTSSLLKKNAGRKTHNRISNQVVNDHDQIQNWIATLITLDKKNSRCQQVQFISH